MCLGLPGQIIAIQDKQSMLGKVSFSGVSREVDLSCVATENLNDLVGKWVLVHVGFAMSVIDEEEAKATLEALEGLAEAQEEFAAIKESAGE
ncbi:HypC/HybG/HupF family hydrogenase formation chaperone [Pseudaquidulcibacter saccharophilus]|uniref:HypC/HybG/HupF family hydrogenase formation chaperone n=1 Tax=Pseudaquidulcibacter saccharophilus TaxID=2831900 RepID=UPI001EFF20A9|nr:HypC/HybG/HupF family hydrogenase formation chaperone [Pseudaquidulcibacter saccharophilus]